MNQLEQVLQTQQLILSKIENANNLLSLFAPSKLNAKQAASIMNCSVGHLTNTIQHRYPEIIDRAATGQKKYILEKLIEAKSKIETTKILQA